MALILKENGSEDSAKPWFSNRQLSVDFVTLVREQERLEGVQKLVSREEGALGVRRGWRGGQGTIHEIESTGNGVSRCERGQRRGSSGASARGSSAHGGRLGRAPSHLATAIVDRRLTRIAKQRQRLG